ncbi:MAG: hypothetical protein AB1626_05795, partial [Candidatus Micrarchaeota archaeon]
MNVEKNKVLLAALAVAVVLALAVVGLSIKQGVEEPLGAPAPKEAEKIAGVLPTAEATATPTPTPIATPSLAATPAPTAAEEGLPPFVPTPRVVGSADQVFPGSWTGRLVGEASFPGAQARAGELTLSDVSLKVFIEPDLGYRIDVE